MSSIIALKETWLTPYVDGAEISLKNITDFRANCVQTRRGGEVALYIKTYLMPAAVAASH